MNWLKNICDKHGTTIYKISKKSGIAETSLYTFNNRYIEDLKLSNCEDIAKSLGMETVDFIEQYYKEYKR